MNEHDLEVGGHRKRNETLHAFFFLYPRRKEYMAQCTFPGCAKKVLARGFCTGHYQQWYRGKPIHRLRHHKSFSVEDFEELTTQLDNGCVIVKDNSRTDLCIYVNNESIPLKRIAYRLFKGDEGDCNWMDDICGNPLCFNPDHLLPHLPIQEGGGRKSINEPVDRQNAVRFWSNVQRMAYGCWEWTGSLRCGYGVFGYGGQRYGSHRFAYRIANGFIPDDLIIDHICRNRKCVNPNHLRLGTQELNRQNISTTTNSRSGHLNVSWSNKDKRWQVNVTRKGETFYGGEYRDLNDAVIAAGNLRNKVSIFNVDDRFPERIGSNSKFLPAA